MRQRLLERPLAKVGTLGAALLFGCAAFILPDDDPPRSAAAFSPSKDPSPSIPPDQAQKGDARSPSFEEKDRGNPIAEEIARLEELAERKALFQVGLLPMEEGEEEPQQVPEPEAEAPALVSPEDEKALEEEEAQPSAAFEYDGNVYDIPIVFNEKVKAYLRLLQTSKREVTAQAFQRAGRYLPMIRQIFKEKGLPQDLINLAYIESAFKINAYSRARAVGIWQFIKSTGRRYGLEVNYWIDERRDPEKSTLAAANYLSDLYTLFESWPLALAAYNAGEQKIQAAIKRHGTRDFWKLRLPRETRLFIPAFMAMTIIAKDPERYGFLPPREEPWEVDRVTVSAPTDLRLVARATGTSVEVIRRLNPELRRGVTPPFAARYELKLPPGSKGDFLEALARIPKERHVLWARSRVRRGETLWRIAKRHRVPLTDLARLNKMGTRQRLRVGSLLLLPIPARIADWEAPRTHLASAKPQKADGRHRVRRGESLWKIARAYDVSVEELSRWNNLDPRDYLYPGQILYVPVPSKTAEVDGPPIRHLREIRHVVRKGDTLWDIARSYSVTIAELRQWNRLRSNRIQPGQILSIFLSR